MALPPGAAAPANPHCAHAFTPLNNTFLGEAGHGPGKAILIHRIASQMVASWAPGAGLHDRQALSFMPLIGKDSIAVSRQRDNRTRIAAPVCKPPRRWRSCASAPQPDVLARGLRLQSGDRLG
jgi:hypothetical protein